MEMFKFDKILFMHKIIIFPAIISCLFLACSKNENPIPEPIADDSDVQYELAKNYFIKNTIENDSITRLKIETQTEFDSIFGMARLMGPDGNPTPIDFEKQFVITVLDTLTSLETEMKFHNLEKEEDDLILTYEIFRGEPKSSSSQSHLTVVVNKSSDGNLKFIQKN